MNIATTTPHTPAPSAPLGDVVRAARAHLSRLHVRSRLVDHAPFVLGVTAFCAALRPFVWTLRNEAAWHSALRTVLLAGVGASVSIGIIVVRAWRNRPSELASARRVDDALGLAEVVASGYAFERDHHQQRHEIKELAIARAHLVVSAVDLPRVLAPSSRRPRTLTERRWIAGTVAALVLALAIGAIDRLVIERTIHPVTTAESSAASELKKAANAVAPPPNDPKSPDIPKPQEHPKAAEAARAARRASEAAERGDRKGAQEALEEMRNAQRALEAEDRDRARSLRALRDAIEASKGDPSKDPSAMRKLAERLETAESTTRSAGESAKKEGSPAAGALARATAALEEARKAAERGDAEGAKRALERAEREMASLEKGSPSSAKSGSMARMAEGASSLDRALRAGAEGKSGEGKEGEGEGKGKGSSSDGEAKGNGSGKSAPGDSKKGDPSGQPGSGPGASDHEPGAEQRRVKVSGNLQARTDVREGEKAVSAIEGMGKGGDPKAYREIFPAYDTAVEDGIREELVPAARRPAVRRYFKSIRPNDE